MIRGITFAEQVFYSADFAHYMNFFLNGGVGVTKGCAITNDGTKVTIGTGYFVAHGRLMNVEVAETIEPSQGYAEGYNRIIYEIDLSKENTITEFKQGYIKIIQTEELVQEDLDAGGKVYQFPLCHFTWEDGEIKGFVVDAPTLVLDDIMQQWSDNFTAINAQFDLWFAQKKAETEAWVAKQRAEVEDLIASFEAQGFEKKALYFSGTLLASVWNKSDKTYSFEDIYPFDDYNLEIQPARTATVEQVKAYGSALLVGSIDSNVVTAKGDVPVVDIPLIIKVTVKKSTPPNEAMLLMGDDDTGIYAEVDGTDYNVQNTANTDELSEDKYNFTII